MNWVKVIEVLKERAEVMEANAVRKLPDDVAYHTGRSNSRVLLNIAHALEAGLEPPPPEPK